MRALSRIGLFIGLGAAVAGCFQSGASSKVTGTITYKGQPVKAGSVFLVYEEGGKYPAALKTDGSYQFVGVPTGNAIVLVDTETFNPDQKPKPYTEQGRKIAAGVSKGLNEYDRQVGGGAMADKSGDAPGPGLSKAQKEEMAKLYVKISPKYANEKTTPLSFTVAPGSQTKNFELSD